MREPSRMQAVQSPIIPVVAELIRNFPGTISLGQGVVSYGPPPQATDELKQFFLDSENHKYKPVQGLPMLLEALERKLECENGIRLGPREAYAFNFFLEPGCRGGGSANEFLSRFEQHLRSRGFERVG